MIINFKEKIGQCFQTNEGYAVEIIDYVDTKNVLIKFVDRPDVQIWSTLQNIKNGQVKIHTIEPYTTKVIMELENIPQEKIMSKQKNI